MSAFLKIVGCLLCVVSSYLVAIENDKAIWFFALGIYIIGKSDYWELKHKL